MNIKNKNGGFVKLVILIVVLLLLMNYFNVSISEAFHFIVNAVRNVLK